jgi:hypothetical protein
VKSLAKQLDANVDVKSDTHGRAVVITHATFKAKPGDIITGAAAG